MTGTFHALLIGVPFYRDDSIVNLPFIENDMAELAAALEKVSYDVTIQGVDQTNKDDLDSAIEFFTADSEPEDTLLIFLSGHGIHYNGMDYLVPSGAMTRSYHFPSRCIPIDFDGYIERSNAGDTVILVDACREGITLLEKGGINAASWSNRVASRTATRRLAYVYACSPGEYARYADDANNTFSLFSRALTQVVRDENGPATLGAIEKAIQDQLDKLVGDYGFPVQQVRVVTESHKDDFAILNRPERARLDTPDVQSWITLAQEHVAWAQVQTGPGVDRLKETTAALVGHLSQLRKQDKEELADDPWIDEAFADRMNARIRWLLSTVLNPGKLQLSPAEAALLVTFPFLHEAFWTRLSAQARHVLPANLGHLTGPDERERFEQFAARYGRLLRRAEQAQESHNSAAVAGIGWWIFHKWLPQQKACFESDRIFELLSGCILDEDKEALAAEVFDRYRFTSMLRNLRVDVALLTETDREAALQPSRLVASATEVEQVIREQLLSYILTAAYRFAIDPRELSEVVVDHLGISYAVSLPELRETIKSASWEARGRTRVLAALCTHPAVELALREQTSDLDSLLGEMENLAISREYLAPLADMPVHATADRVRAATSADGVRAYDSTDLRFRLADDRIQELLMGENLYGDPALAIRELYQNALDACRYRSARNEFLRRMGKYLPPWKGEITFRQGTDEAGRPFVDCRDNGIGMGMRELTAVFSQAGMRFADLGEFIEELSAWRAAGIDLYPNSQFGIGVLSYFMLADDITVTTCRSHRNGDIGDILEVQIAGPGALFRVRSLGRGSEAGTTVRLHLRPSAVGLSCTGLLRRIVWISDYDIEATDYAGTVTWQSYQLSAAAPVGARDDPLDSNAEGESRRIVASSTPVLWWCNSDGGILADGLWVGAPLYGAVINLTAQHMPSLTVDRKAIVVYDEAEVTRLLYAEIPSLFVGEATVCDCVWLSNLAGHNAELADHIAQYAVSIAYRPWKAAGREADITVVGCFLTDCLLFGEERDGADRRKDERNRLPTLPPEIVKWRVLAWAKAGLLGDGLSTTRSCEPAIALPSDYILVRVMREDSSWSTDWDLIEDVSRNRGALRRSRATSVDTDGLSGPVSVAELALIAARTDRLLGEVAVRLAALGFTVPEPGGLPDRLDADDLILLSRDLDGGAPWLDPGEPVPFSHFAKAASRGRSPVEVAARLAALGFTVPEPGRLPDRLDADDLILLSRNLNRDSPWLMVEESVPYGHMAAASARTGRSPVEVAARLAALGFTVPEPGGLPDRLDADDLILLSRDLDGGAPWLDPGEPVPFSHFAEAASGGRSPVEVAARLAALGFTVPEPGGLPDRLDADDLILLSRDLDGGAPWLDPGEPIPFSHFAKAASRGRSPVEVAVRLAALGFTVPEPGGLPDRLDADDLILLSRDLDGGAPWLDPGEPVPFSHFAKAASRGRSPVEVAARLAALGFTVPEPGRLPDRLDADDLILLSRNLNRDSPWLMVEESVPYGHMAAASARTGRSPVEVAARLAALGFTVPEPGGLPDRLDADDLILLSRDLDGGAPWLDSGEPIPYGHLAGIARSGRNPAEAAARLAALGFTVPEPGGLPDRLDADDLILLSRDLDGGAPWLDSGEPIPYGHLAGIARSGRNPAEAAARLVKLGFLLPDALVLGDQR